MGNVTHFDASYGFDTRTACKKSTHIYADALRSTPIKLTKNVYAVTCKVCRKAIDKKN